MDTAIEAHAPSRLGVPGNQHCLVVQMPSVEEMRREVADITCQMQSVYLSDESMESDDTNGPRDASHQKQSPTKQNVLGSANVTLDRKFHTMTRSNTNGDSTSLKPRSSGELKSNTIGRMMGIGSGMTGTSTDKETVLSSLPREEQVSEEFVIDGKRYRQTYQRRIVLERRITRDVFFLPSNTMDSKLFGKTKETNDSTTHVNSSDITDGLNSETDFRPRLDVSIHPKGSNSDEARITPTVVVRQTSCSPRKYPSQTSSTPQLCQQVGAPEISLSENAGLIESTPTTPRPTKRGTSFRNALTKHITNSKVYRSLSVRLNNSLHDNGKGHAESTLGRNTNSALNQTLTQDAQHDGCCEIVGYMYRFGVWDNQAPVLDPRLPIATNIETPGSVATATRRGTVIPNPPEWHHEEVGLGRKPVNEEVGTPLVRGRMVACVQRFTQQSASGGKPLHRSTYVQQTRLVRQRDSSKSTRPITDGDSEKQSTVLEGDNSLMKDLSVYHDLPIPTKIRTGDADQPEQFDDVSVFARCHPERLQLLQSICPTAAAATILLGRQYKKNDRFDEDGYSEDEGMKDGQSDSEDRSICVNATSWCPAALIAQDLSPYLTLNQPKSPESDIHSEQLKSQIVPSLKIRAATLEGLIAYVLRLLQTTTDKGAADMDALCIRVFRFTYPVFTTAECLVDKLIQVYVAHAPIEPGCQSREWTSAMTAATFLVDITMDLQENEMVPSLVLRLARFARLLQMDSLICQSNLDSNSTALSSNHTRLADCLTERLPLYAANAASRGRILRPSPVEKEQRLSVQLVKMDGHPRRSGSIDPRKLAQNVETRQNGFMESNKKNVTRRKSQDSNIPTPLIATHIKSSSGLDRAGQLLKVDARSIAMEITRMEDDLFANIDFNEFLDIRRLEHGEAHTLSKCVEHFNRVTRWARSLLLVWSPKQAENTWLREAAMEHSTDNKKSGKYAHVTSEKNGTKLCGAEKMDSDRCDPTCVPGFHTSGAKQKSIRLKQFESINLMFTQMCAVLKHLKSLKNFNSFLAVLLAVQEVPETILSKKSKSLLTAFSCYMKPPMFTEYRRDLEAAQLPYLPYLGLIFQQLIHLDVGNSIFFTDTPSDDVHATIITSSDNNPIRLRDPLSLMQSTKSQTTRMINIWRCWKHYLILGYFVERKQHPETSRHRLPVNEKVRELLNQFEDCFPESILDHVKSQMSNRSKSKRTHGMIHIGHP